MTRSLVLSIIGYVFLSFVLASIFHFIFSDILPYAAGEHEALPWTQPIAFLTTASVWLWAEVAGIFVIMLAAACGNDQREVLPRAHS